MRKLLVVGAVLVCAASAQAQEYKFTYVTHGTAGAPFWQTVKAGMDEACATLKVSCQITFLQRTGNLAEELNALNAAVAQQTDGLVVTLPSDTMFNLPLQEAAKAGIPIVVTNTTVRKPVPGVPNLPYIGQDLEQAGYELAKGLCAQFPKDGPIHVLIGVSVPGQNWAEQRAAGVERFLKEYAAANPDGRSHGNGSIPAPTSRSPAAVCPPICRATRRRRRISTWGIGTRASVRCCADRASRPARS